MTDDLKQLGEVVRPRRKKVTPQEFPSLPYIGLEHVEAHTSRLIGYSEATEMKSAANYFLPGDVLYSRLRPYLNKVWRADREGLCSSEFIVLPGNDTIDPDFLRYRLNSPDFVSFANSLNAGDRPRVDFEQISRFKTWLPSSLVRQRRIVAEIEKQFTRLDAGVAALRRVLANLKRYRAAVLKAACEGRLVPTEAELARKEGRTFETGEQLLQRILAHRRKNWTRRGSYKEPVSPNTANLPKAPSGWAWASIDQLMVESMIGLDRGRAQQSKDAATGLPYIKMNNITMDGRVLFDDMMFVPADKEEAATFAVWDGDILFNTRNSKELVGKVGLVRSPPIGAIYNNNLMRIRTSNGVNPAFLSLQMCSHAFRQRMELVKKATTNIAAVYGKDLWPLPIALPPLAEQNRIVAEVERRLSVIDELETIVTANLARTTRLRQAALRQAFDGHSAT